MQSNPGRAFYGSSLVFCVFGMACAVGAQPAQPLSQPQDLSPEQLDALVAPIALYPDPLLGQALAASTYPLELVAAQQWLQQHADLHGSALMDAARQLNCDASVQAMVAFPDVLRLLTQNIRWTTDLGNAVLTQRSGVLDAIQRLRNRAAQNGYLTDSSRQVVTTEPGPVQNAISIQPADPEVLHVPAYVPDNVWGPPAAGQYPSLWYPAVSSGSGFSSAVQICDVLSGLLSWSAWGWGLNWLAHGLFQNGSFLANLASLGSGGGYEGGSGVTVWAHNPVHRLGVPYSNNAVARGFGGSYRASGFVGSGSGHVGQSGFRPSAPSGGWRFFGSSNSSENAGRGWLRGEARASQAPPPGSGRLADPGSNRAMPRSYGSLAPPHFSGGGHSASGRFSGPKSTGHFKAPKFSSHSSRHSSKGRSGGHGKNGHRR